MANMRPFIIAIAFALIAVALVYMYINKIQSEQPSDIAMITVVRATENIQPNTTILDTMLEEIEVPEETVAEGTVTELEEILGQVSMINIFEGVVLMDQMFEIESMVEKLDRMLEPGMRAVTVGVTEVSGLGGNIKPGDQVDVMVTILSNDEVGVPSTFTVLRNVSVMAVGQDIGFNDDNLESGQVSKSVTLKVESLMAERLALASEVGSIRLSLRDPDDIFVPVTGGTPLTEFVVYTPTREDLEEAAAKARTDRLAADQRDHERRIEEMRLYAELGQSPDFDPSQFDSEDGGLVLPETKNTVPIELIMGGELTIVEIAVPDK